MPYDEVSVLRSRRARLLARLESERKQVASLSQQLETLAQNLHTTSSQNHHLRSENGMLRRNLSEARAPRRAVSAEHTLETRCDLRSTQPHATHALAPAAGAAGSRAVAGGGPPGGHVALPPSFAHHPVPSNLHHAHSAPQGASCFHPGAYLPQQQLRNQQHCDHPRSPRLAPRMPAGGRRSYSGGSLPHMAHPGSSGSSTPRGGQAMPLGPPWQPAGRPLRLPPAGTHPVVASHSEQLEPLKRARSSSNRSYHLPGSPAASRAGPCQLQPQLLQPPHPGLHPRQLGPLQSPFQVAAAAPLPAAWATTRCSPLAAHPGGPNTAYLDTCPSVHSTHTSSWSLPHSMPPPWAFGPPQQQQQPRLSSSSSGPPPDWSSPHPAGSCQLPQQAHDLTRPPRQLSHQGSWWSDGGCCSPAATASEAAEGASSKGSPVVAVPSSPPPGPAAHSGGRGAAAALVAAGCEEAAQQPRLGLTPADVDAFDEDAAVEDLLRAAASCGGELVPHLDLTPADVDALLRDAGHWVVDFNTSSDTASRATSQPDVSAAQYPAMTSSAQMAAPVLTAKLHPGGGMQAAQDCGKRPSPDLVYPGSGKEQLHPRRGSNSQGGSRKRQHPDQLAAAPAGPSAGQPAAGTMVSRTQAAIAAASTAGAATVTASATTADDLEAVVTAGGAVWSGADQLLEGCYSPACSCPSVSGVRQEPEAGQQGATANCSSSSPECLVSDWSHAPAFWDLSLCVLADQSHSHTDGLVVALQLATGGGPMRLDI